MADPEKRPSPSPTHARGLWRGYLSRAYLWRQLRLAPLAFSGVLARSVSQAEPSHGPLPLPPMDQRLMRAILLLRGLYDNNDLGTKAMSGCAARALKTLEREATVRDADPLPSIDWPGRGSPEVYERFVRRHHPVVIKGVPTGTAHWSIDWLVENHGRQPFPLMDSSGAIYEGGKIRDLLHPAPNGGPFYMHNNNFFFDESPHYRDDLCVNDLADMVRRKATLNMGLFASMQEGTRSFMHCANNMNTFMLLEGSKRWTLVDPHYFLLVYPYLSHTNNYQLSLIRGDDPHDALPLYRYCPRFTVDLEPGDCLLVPPLWYHCIKNLTSRTLAASVRWLPHQRGEVLTNRLFRFLDGAANRNLPGGKGVHQDSTELVGTGLARASWGLPQG